MFHKCPILSWLVENHIRVELVEEGYKVYGFYKSDALLLKPVSEVSEEDQNKENPFLYLAIGRYGEKDEIRDKSDLLWLNMHWWEVSSGRVGSRDVVYPDPAWAPLLVEAGMLEKKEGATLWIRK